VESVTIDPGNAVKLHMSAFERSPLEKAGQSDLAIVGAMETVGRKVGLRVGIGVGEFPKYVGCCVDRAVGLAEGATVGKGVGKGVGIIVGCTVGKAEGKADGCSLGTAEGTTVGTEDGAGEGAVGCALGMGLGERVGVDDGCTVGGFDAKGIVFGLWAGDKVGLLIIGVSRIACPDPLTNVVPLHAPELQPCSIAKNLQTVLAPKLKGMSTPAPCFPGREQVLKTLGTLFVKATSLEELSTPPYLEMSKTRSSVRPLHRPI